MKYFRHSKFLRCLWLLVALHILNFSIDNPDLQCISAPEDLSYNEIETLVEFALENVLGIENAIPEYDDPDSDNALHLHKTVTIDLYCSAITMPTPVEGIFNFEEKEKISPFQITFYAQNHTDSSFQPPEA